MLDLLAGSLAKDVEFANHDVEFFSAASEKKTGIFAQPKIAELHQQLRYCRRKRKINSKWVERNMVLVWFSGNIVFCLHSELNSECLEYRTDGRSSCSKYCVN